MEAYLLDTNFKIVAIVDSFISFVWTDRYNGYGDFELELPGTVENMNLYKTDFYLQFSESEHMMIVEEIYLKHDAEEGPKITIKGRSLESILDRRIAYRKQTFTSEDIQNIALALVEVNFVSPHLVTPAVNYSPDGQASYRSISDFVVSKNTSLVGDTITASYFGENIYDSVVELLKKMRWGFKIVRMNNLFTFRIYNGTDRSYDQSAVPHILFSPKMDNLVSSEYAINTQNLKTFAMVALAEPEDSSDDSDNSDDSESSTERPVYYVKNTNVSGVQNGLYLREIYVDASDVTATTEKYHFNSETHRYETSDYTLTAEELTAAAKEKAASAFEDLDAVEAFSGELTVVGSYQYGVDYFLGDVVQIEDTFGMTGKSRISEIVFSEDANGYVVTPTFVSLTDEEEEATE